MFRWTTVAGAGALAVLASACSESAGPERNALRPPERAAAAVTGIVLDQQTGVAGETGIEIGQGFNPTNPHRGDAIIATFFWAGSTNTITKVVDHLSDADDAAATPVGNTYTLVEYVTAGGISMATYVATNVQGFPDPNPGTVVLAVRANLSDSVADGGIVISAWSGVEGVFAQAGGEHRSSSGSGSAPTVAAPGVIPVNAGALAYGVTMASAVVGHQRPAGFVNLGAGTDAAMSVDAEYAVLASAGSVDPQWTWFFSPESPGTSLATVLALNPASAELQPATHVAFTLQPSATTAGSAITPPVQVAALDDAGNTVTSFSGLISVVLGANSSGATLAGAQTVAAIDGVATFPDLSIARAGDGYTLVATASGLTSATSATFTITPGPATQLVFTVQPSTTPPLVPIQPAVQVTARDAHGNQATSFTGLVTIAIGRNGGLLLPGTLFGTTTVPVINGVATFSDLKIDQKGNGYTLVVGASGLLGAESAQFNIAVLCVGSLCA